MHKPHSNCYKKALRRFLIGVNSLVEKLLKYGNR